VEKLAALDGKTLLVFNHKSYLDFALNFFALGEIRNKGRHLRPRFIAAKDHFIDNPLIYSWLGVGKCIEKAGMIFINRRKGKGWLAMKEAAEKLAESDVEVAVYPQGTRAWGLKDESGRRIDAGYYTTLSKKTLEDPKGHLKKGTAQLILDTALRLREKGEPPLKILFIGIDGTATVGPKGSFKIQTESEVTFRIGRIWKVELAKELSFENPQGSTPTNEAQKNYSDELEAIHAQLDREMEKTIGRNRTLTERAASDPRIPKNTASSLQRFLQRADATENILPFAILDRIYALPPARWRNHLEYFTQLALERTDDEGAWETFNQEVSLELIRK
jgi:1-acyl-sn-glycerol-3-phosphate acyltransferase